MNQSFVSLYAHDFNCGKIVKGLGKRVETTGLAALNEGVKLALPCVTATRLTMTVIEINSTLRRANNDNSVGTY